MNRQPIKLLLAEDVASDAELELRELKRAGLRVVHRLADTEEAFTAAVHDFQPDLILSDFSMPHFDGMAALALARELCPDVPFLFVSGTIGEEYAIRALKNGATDYVLKTNLVRLPAAVERALAEAQEKRERRRTEDELELARGRLTSIFESLSDVLWSVDAGTDRIAYVSAASNVLFGRPPEAFIESEELWLDVVHPEDRPRVRAAWDAMRDRGAFDIEYRVLLPDRSVRWVHDRGRQVKGPDGRVQRIDGVARDVTEHVAHRNRIARLSRIRDISSAVNAALVRLTEPSELLAEVCRIAVAQGGLLGANVAILTDEAPEARWVASAGVMPDDLRASAVPGDAASSGITGRVLLTLQPAVWNDLLAESDARYREAMLAQGVRSAAALPLVVNRKAYGSLCLYSSEARYFDQEEMRLFTELSANISFALESIAKQERIAYLAHYDALTGLPNRTLFYETLGEVMQEASRSKTTLGLAMFDLERFKALNDTYGKEVGDRVLQAVADRLRASVGNVTRAARLGSNVFALILHSPSRLGDEGRAYDREAHRFFSAPFSVDGREIVLTVKAGIAVFPQDGEDADTLFRNAEASLKRAKETGEACVVYDPRINARVAEQTQLEARLRKAVERGELCLHYQPKVDLVSRKVIGVEALMRWSLDGAAVSPVKFVPALERTGLILEAGRQAIVAAARTYATWKARGLAAPRIAVNVSAIQLARRSFVADVRAALAEGGGDGVDLEVTESLLMTEIEDSIRKLRELRETGIRVSLDDFGTGYSSLAYLGKLPVDTLKIDRGFVRGMTENPDDTSIISIIISLAQALRLKVVAEGVETEQQAQLLKLLRCDEGQGYLFSPPVPAERIEAVLAARV